MFYGEKSHEIYEDLAASSIETLFIWGDDDAAVPFSESQQHLFTFFKDRNPPTSVILLHTAGHALFLDYQFLDHVSAVMIDWFNLSVGSVNQKFLRYLRVKI